MMPLTKPVLHKHNVNISGGTENTKYMASVGYLGQTGILPNSNVNNSTAVRTWI